MFTNEEKLWGRCKNYYHVKACLNCLARKGISLIAPQDCPRLPIKKDDPFLDDGEDPFHLKDT